MTGPQKKKSRKETLQFLKVLAVLSEKQLQVIAKYLNGTGVDLIGTLVHNLTDYKNPTLDKDGRKNCQSVLMNIQS